MGGGRRHRRKLRAAALAAWAALAAPAGACAGAWTLRQGAAEMWSQTLLSGASSAFGAGYGGEEAGTYRKVEQNLRLEYGLYDGLTMVLQTQFLAVTLGHPAAVHYSGAGYTDFGARLRLAEGAGWVVSAEATGRAPGAGGSPAAVGYTAWEADLRVLGGLSFPLWQRPAFLDVELAQRQRFGPPPDEFRLDATLGVEAVSGWLVLVQSFNVVSEGAGEAPDFDLPYEYYKLQIGLLVEVDRQLTVGAAVFTTWLARNFPEESGVTLAARYRF